MKNARITCFIIGGVISIIWGLVHIIMFLPVTFDPTLMLEVLPDGASMDDTAMLFISDLITLFNNAIIIYMVGIGLLMVLGARTFAASRLGVCLLVMHIVFWVVRAVVPLFQNSNMNAILMPFFAISLSIYIVPLFLKRQAESASA